MKIETIETLANVGSKATATGAVVGGVGAFIASNFVGLVGLFIALLGLLVNVHYRRKADKRHAQAALLYKADADARARERELRMDLMRAGVPVSEPTSDLAELGAEDD